MAARASLLLACVAFAAMAHPPDYNLNMQHAQELIQSGGDLNVKDADGYSVLSRAARDGIGTYVTEVLLAARVDTEVTDANGWTPLLASIHNGYTNLARQLAEAGANTEAVDSDGLTPLLHAAEDGNLEGVEAMLDNNASWSFRNKHNATALHLAVRNGHPMIVQKMMDLGVDPNEVDKHGLTPLYYAAANGRASMVLALLKGGADADIGIDCRGLGPLAAAAVNHCIACFDYMIAYGASTNILGTVTVDFQYCPMTEPIDQTMDVSPYCRFLCYPRYGFDVGVVLKARAATYFLNQLSY